MSDTNWVGIAEYYWNTENVWFETTVPKVEKVLFHPPATVVFWADGTKTVVRTMPGDVFDEHVGFMAAVTRKLFGGHNQYKKYIKNAVRKPAVEESALEMSDG